MTAGGLLRQFGRRGRRRKDHGPHAHVPCSGRRRREEQGRKEEGGGWAVTCPTACPPVPGEEEEEEEDQAMPCASCLCWGEAEAAWRREGDYPYHYSIYIIIPFFCVFLGLDVFLYICHAGRGRRGACPPFPTSPLPTHPPLHLCLPFPSCPSHPTGLPLPSPCTHVPSHYLFLPRGILAHGGGEEASPLVLPCTPYTPHTPFAFAYLPAYPPHPLYT